MESRQVYELELAELMGLDTTKIETKEQQREQGLEEPLPKIPATEQFYEGQDLRKSWK